MNKLVPARKIYPRRGAKVGYYPSITMGEMIPYESSFERKFLQLADHANGVTKIEGQPLKIPYEFNNKTRSYYVDFRLKYFGETLFTECKRRKYVDDPKNRAKFAGADTYCQQNGDAFFLLTEDEIEEGYRLKNVVTLTDCARYRVSEQSKWEIKEALKIAGGSLSLGRLKEKVSHFGPDDAEAFVYCMLYYNDLYVDLDTTLLNAESTVFLPVLIKDNPNVRLPFFDR